MKFVYRLFCDVNSSDIVLFHMISWVITLLEKKMTQMPQQTAVCWLFSKTRNAREEQQQGTSNFRYPTLLLP